jgi:hypothetical protein
MRSGARANYGTLVQKLRYISFELLGAMQTRVLPHHPGSQPLAHLQSLVLRCRSQMVQRVLACLGNQNILAGLEDLFQTAPVVCDDRSPASRGLE